MKNSSQQLIPRFNAVERAIHWAVAITFVYATLSGLSLWSRKLYWIAGVLGGGVTVRAMHPLISVLFVLAFGRLFLKWRREMVLDADDRTWLRYSYKYALKDDAGLPEVGKYNGGQKMQFWAQAALAVVLLCSGTVLWFPEYMPRTLRLAAVLIHPAAALAAMGGIIVHVYMGTAAVPGSLKAMIRGVVTRRWAAAHHPKWLRNLPQP